MRKAIVVCFTFKILCMYHKHAWCLQKPEERTAYPETVDLDGCELPRVLLPTKPSFHPRKAIGNHTLNT